MTRRFKLAFAIGVLLTGTAFAHDTVLLPEIFVGSSPVALSLTSAEKFPALEYGPKASRISNTKIVGPDASARIKVVAESETALKLALNANRNGTYVVGVELAPHDIELSPDKVAEYFAEIDAPASLRAAYDALPQPRVWRETYTKHAKAVVCVARCESPEVLTRALGLRLEFTLLIPNDPRPGQPKAILWRDGKTLPRTAVAITRADGTRSLEHTDADGAIALPTDGKGPMLLSAVIVDAPEKPGEKFVSDFATLTLDATLLSRR